MGFDNFEDDLECETCSRNFRSSHSRFQHMQDRKHFRTYCQPCDRNFINGNALDQHLKSGVHQGRNIKCPFCKSGFVTGSGVSHHLEQGSCPRAPNVNRETLYRMIRVKDPHGVITQKQIGWHDNESTPTVVAWDLSNAWNGSRFECYICHESYQRRQSLRQHLESPVHARKLYHCLNSSCGKEFAGLAMLFNHLESESCNFAKFEEVQRSASAVLTGGRLIGFV